MPLHCPSCGSQAAAEAKFCQRCGASLTGAPPAGIQAAVGAAGMAAAAGGTDVGPEVDLWSGSYCWKHMIGSWIMAFFATIVLVAGAFFLINKVPQVAPHGTIVWLSVAGVIGCIWGYLLLVLLYRQLSISYRLTSELFTMQRGILTITHDRLELIDIDDITVEQGIVDRMLGIGTIVIRSSDTSDPILPLLGIDDVHTVAELLDKARRKKRSKAMKVEAI